jgi:hypothetical protein
MHRGGVLTAFRRVRKSYWLAALDVEEPGVEEAAAVVHDPASSHWGWGAPALRHTL